MLLKHLQYVTGIALFIIFIPGCSGFHADLVAGTTTPVSKANTVKGTYGVALTRDVTDNIIIGTELQHTEDILGEKYQLAKRNYACLLNCSPTIVNSKINLEQILITLLHTRDKEHYYKFALGKYTAMSSNSSDDWFSPVYSAPSGYTIPNGIAGHVGVGYVYYQSPGVKLSIEANAMWLHGDGKLITETGKVKNLDDLSSIGILFRFGYY